jgi:ABC-type amino acid transport system permease subunit
VWNNTTLILIAGTIALTQLMSARISGHIYSALKSINEDQRKSAKAQGLTTYQTFRYVLIPQSLKNALPSITGEVKNTFKNSAALKLIGLMEVCGMMEQVINSTTMTIECFLICLAIYLVLNSVVDLASFAINKIIK